MSRKILYRGKRLDNGEWVYGNLVTKYPYHKGLTIVENDVYHEVHPETVGQYTGTDIFSKGFKKVFVGDLFQDENGTILEVIFEIGTFGFGAWRKEGEWLSMKLLKKRCKLVGNKWDNPELLEALRDETR